MEEEVFFAKLRTSPDLWWERVKNTEKRQEQYQKAKEKQSTARVTLKDYVVDISDDIEPSTIPTLPRKRKGVPSEDMCGC